MSELQLAAPVRSSSARVRAGCPAPDFWSVERAARDWNPAVHNAALLLRDRPSVEDSERNRRAVHVRRAAAAVAPPSAQQLSTPRPRALACCALPVAPWTPFPRTASPPHSLPRPSSTSVCSRCAASSLLLRFNSSSFTFFQYCFYFSSSIFSSISFCSYSFCFFFSCSIEASSIALALHS